MLSDSSSESDLLPFDSSCAAEFLKGEMWVKSKILSSSMLMMGMSRLQRESGGAERTSEEKRTDKNMPTDPPRRAHRDVLHSRRPSQRGESNQKGTAGLHDAEHRQHFRGFTLTEKLAAGKRRELQ